MASLEKRGKHSWRLTVSVGRDAIGKIYTLVKPFIAALKRKLNLNLQNSRLKFTPEHTSHLIK